MLERLGFQHLVEETLTVKRVPRAMSRYQFVLAMVLAAYVVEGRREAGLAQFAERCLGLAVYRGRQHTMKPTVLTQIPSDAVGGQ
jgi:hypothetical protein